MIGRKKILLGAGLITGVFLVLFFGVRIYDSVRLTEAEAKLTPVPTKALVDNRGELPAPTETVITLVADVTFGAYAGNAEPSVTDTPGDTDTPAATPAEEPVYEKLDPFIDAKEIQQLVIECCFGYGRNEYYSLLGEDVRLTPDGIKGLMFDEYHVDMRCAEIPLNLVTPGDLCVSDDCVGFCFTYDPEGHPLFVYFIPEDESADTLFRQFYLKDYGVFLGYVLSDKDKLFFGAVPVNATRFYDTGHGAGYPTGVFNNSSIYEDVYKYASTLNQEGFDNAVYMLGRALCLKDREYIKSVNATYQLSAEEIRANEEAFMALCDDFLNQVGSESYREFTIIPGAGGRTRIMYSDYFYFKGQVLSLDSDTYLQKSGEFEFTLVCDNTYNTMTFLPYAVREIEE